MIQAVDQAVENFFRTNVPLPETTVDVAFEAPDRTWGAGLTRPTVNIFLWRVSRNEAGTTTGLQQRPTADGGVERRRALPLVDLSYLVTAWATEVRDEHQLLGSVLEAVVAFDWLPQDVLPDRLAGSRCRIGLARHEPNNPGDLWTSLDGRLKPCVQMVVTLPLAVFDWKRAAAPPQEVAANVGRAPVGDDGDDEPLLRRRRAGGALVMEGRPGRAEGVV